MSHSVCVGSVSVIPSIHTFELNKKNRCKYQSDNLVGVAMTNIGTFSEVMPFEMPWHDLTFENLDMKLPQHVRNHDAC